MSQPEAASQPISVLVVDDEASVCRSVEKILCRKGYQVEQALCVSSALNTLEAGTSFDLIIADLMMPQVGGLELLKIVRDRWPDTPVLIITGYASIASAVEATRYGAIGYLPKPFTPQELEEAVQQVLTSPPRRVPQAADLMQAGPIDVDLPFDERELASATSARYVEHLTRSDMPLVEHAPVSSTDYCSKGQRSCKRMAKQQQMCKQPECPLIVAERKKAARAGVVVSLAPDPIDVDMPFSRTEVASMTGEAYVNALGRSDMPVTGFWRSPERSAQVPKVLVVDDEPVVVNSIRKTLAKRAFKVAEAFSGREALSRVTSESFDLVLLDMKLPDANGLDLVSDL
jgi:DNA-binding response OmpR family regulator